MVACLLVSGLAVISFLPGGSKHILHTRGRFHSWGHLLSFAVVAFVAMSVTRSSRGRILWLGGLVLFGFGIEAAERLVFGNPMEWKDVGMDAIGAACGAIAAVLTAPKRG